MRFLSVAAGPGEQEACVGLVGGDAGGTAGEVVDAELGRTEEPSASSWRRGSLRRLAAPAAALLGGLALLLGLSRHDSGWQPHTRGDPAGLLSAFDPLTSGAAGLPGIPMGEDNEPSELIPGVPLMTGPNSPAGAPAPAPSGMVGTPTPAPSATAPGAVPGCGYDEESYLGLCYKKCAYLTNGTYPRRIAPNGCCMEMSMKCMLPSETDFKGFLPGQGYNVGGDGGNPHPMGMCDGNEEMYGALCYKKCSVLTDSAYPIRSGAATCCRKTPCWDIFHLKTNGGDCTGFTVGGGMEPDHACPHSPTVTTPTTPR